MNFWADLRRRRVYRLAAIYIVGAWLVLQVADIFFPAWGVPDTAMRYLIIAAALCFPIALVFGWFFDITAGSIVRTREAGEDEVVDMSLRRGDFAILIALLLVGGAVVIGSLNKIIESANDVAQQAEIAEKLLNSVAVLPFVNLDANAETAYFSEGVSEEILHRLASVRALRVLGRTSSFPFGSSKLSSKRISDILGVRYLLNGSVRREGNLVRLTARLVDDQGFQLWSDTYDGELEKIFDFQTEIAANVASQIVSELIEPVAVSAARVTDSPEAYLQYLIGREYFHKRPPNWNIAAAEAYRQAINLDPDYAPPYAGLAIALTLTNDPEDVTAIRLEAEAAVERAFELDTQLAEAYMARGLVAAEVRRTDADQASAANDYEKAIELDPSQSMAYNWLAIVYRRLGRDAEADNAQDRGLEVDPLNPMLLVNTSDRFLARGDFDGKIAALKQILKLPEPPGLVFRSLSDTHFEYGHLVEALQWAKEAVRTYCDATCGRVAVRLPDIYLQLGMQDDAAYWIQQYYRVGGDPRWNAANKLYWLLLQGDAEQYRQTFGAVDAVALFQQFSMSLETIGVANLIEGRPEVFVDFVEDEMNVAEQGLAQTISGFNDADSVDFFQKMAHADS